MSDFATGWINDPLAVQAYLDHRTAIGMPAAVSEARPDLAGFWRDMVMKGARSVLLYQAEEELRGNYLDAIFQRRGTCTAQGSFRAIEVGYWYGIAERRITGEPRGIVSETLYAGGRVQVGRGQIGPSHRWGCTCRRCPDGLPVAWAARFAHEYGILPRGVYGDIDLTNPREDLAILWADPARGVPRELLTASDAYRCDVYHVPNANVLADVTAAGYGSAIGSSHEQNPTRDANGECGYFGETSHCEAIVGVYMRPTWDGRPESIYDHTGLVDQQSWGARPGGPDILRIHGGSAKLREGAYGQPMPAMRKRLATGETWAYRLRDGFRAKSLKDALR